MNQPTWLRRRFTAEPARVSQSGSLDVGELMGLLNVRHVRITRVQTWGRCGPR